MLFRNKIGVINNLKRCHTTWNLSKYPEFNIDYLCNKNNIEKIEENIKKRKGIGNIKLVNELKSELDNCNETNPQFDSIKAKFYEELFRIPNDTHPEVLNLNEEPKLVKLVNEKFKIDGIKFKEFYEITKRLNLVRTDQLGNVCGSKSYFLMGEMAELEHSLIRYFTEILLKLNFQLISVPDILHRDIIERCGMNTKGDRNQVYTLDPQLHPPDLCLSGTSEMALAGYLMNKTFNEDELPLRLMAVSRCFRAETSSTAEERGIYRVHEFTKVEMFVVTNPEDSNDMLEEIRKIQEDCFESLQIHFQVLDMPPHELGAPAYRKYDIEAWMPGRGMYGEISSCSNCTDYQSRRLGITYQSNADQKQHFVHTLNGTACAIPRLLIALTETGQKPNGTITIPLALRKYMNDKEVIGRQKVIPDLKLIKMKK